MATALMAVLFVPLVLLTAFGAAGWFSRAWWRALREVWRSH